MSTDPSKGTTPVPDLATDTGTSNEDGNDLEVHRQGRRRSGRTASRVTCEDFKYGVSRTFATDVITGGPNYILGFLDVPEDKDGLPVYNGPYKTTTRPTSTRP